MEKEEQKVEPSPTAVGEQATAPATNAEPEAGTTAPMDVAKKEDVEKKEDVPQQSQNPRNYFPGVTLLDSISSAFYFYWSRPFLGTFHPAGEMDGGEKGEKEADKQPDGAEKEGKKDIGHYEYVTYAEVWNRASNFGAGLRQHGIKPTQFLGICSKNRVEWVLADYACALQNFISVPLHTILSQEQVDFILDETHMVCVVCNRDQFPKYAKAAPKCPNLKFIVLMSDHPYEQSHEEEELPALPEHVKLLHFLDVEILGASSPLPPEKRQPNDLCTIMYTSGSTGMPKGAMMTDLRYNNFIAKPYLMPDPQNIYISMCYGGSIALYDGEMDKLFDHVLLVSPTSFTAVPRIWNQLYGEFQHALVQAQAEAPHRDKAEVEKEVLERFSHVLGDKAEYIVTGGAPTSPAVLDFLKRCFKCVYDGYGTTEVGGISTGNVISWGVDVKLADVPELGYTSADQPYPRGEICVKTPDMIGGYFKNEKATKESFDEEGYFRTGDIGMRTAPDTVIIIDRKKNVFKLSQGEFIAPEKLENIFIGSEFIDQIYVHGDTLKSYLVAIVVPNVEVLFKWAREQSQLSSIFEQEKSKWVSLLCANKDVNEKLVQEIQHISEGKELPPYEIPRAVWLDSEKFTPENGLLTPSMKLCRGPFGKHYKTIIEENLYKAVENTQSALLQVLNETLEGGAKDSSSLQDLGVDSISAVRFAALVKQKFNKEIPLQMLLQPTSIADLALFIENSSTAGTGQINPAEKDLKDPALLKLGPASTEGNAIVGHEGEERILLTGATGFLGVFLLDEALREFKGGKGPCVVYCLVRAASEKEATERVRKNLEEKCGWDETKWKENAARIRVLQGDLDQPLLGLGETKFAELCNEITTIYHCGAIVNWLYSYAKVREANVIGTLEILKLATTTHVKTLHFISTIGVARQSENDAWPSDSLHLLSGYSLSKWVAEHFVQLAGKKGLPITVFRPGMITGHSRSGASNERDFINRYLRGCIQLGNYIDEPGTQDITPVDYVAGAIVYLSQQKPSLGKAFHLTNPNPASFGQIGKFIASSPVAKTRLEPLKYAQWRQHFVERFQARKAFEEKEKKPDKGEKEETDRENDCALFGLFPYFSESYGDYLTGKYPQTVFEVTNTLEGLKDSNIACPETTEELVHTYLHSLAQRGLF